MIASHHDTVGVGRRGRHRHRPGLGPGRVLGGAAPERRPHRLVFVLQGGHMVAGAGLRRYIADHRDELASVVLEVHLEHAAREFAERTDWAGHQLEPTGLVTPRWWFTSRNPDLEAAVLDTLEQLDRSMLVAPDAVGGQPPTDGGFYHAEGCRSSTSWPRPSTSSTPWTRSTRSTGPTWCRSPGRRSDRRVDWRLGRRDAGGRRPPP